MHAGYWYERWREGRIGFHLNDTNPNLTEWFDRLDLKPGSRIFVPLCGKSVDMLWLVEQGMEVVGVELLELGALAAVDRILQGQPMDREDLPQSLQRGSVTQADHVHVAPAAGGLPRRRRG